MATITISWERPIERVNGLDAVGVGLRVRRDGERMGLVTAYVGSPALPTSSVGELSPEQIGQLLAAVGSELLRDELAIGDELPDSERGLQVPGVMLKSKLLAGATLPDSTSSEPLFTFEL